MRPADRLASLRELREEQCDALDLEQAREEAGGSAALTLAFCVSRFLHDGLLGDVPDVVRELVTEYDAAHSAVLDAREAEERGRQRPGCR
jgi:hypothetical protein